MKVELKEISVKELTSNYQDKNEEGVFGFNGNLDIRPPFQREFVYNEKQRESVISTLTQGFPLNVMYWAAKENNNFEIIDGQQRTISICQYVNGDFAYKQRYFHNLQNDEKNKILEYKLTIYICSGADSEKLEWFKTINIAGEELTNQELRNAVYAGTWVTDAKRYFSKRGCAAYQIGSDYLSGSSIRQDYLETAIKWISNDEIEKYMGLNQHADRALELWEYFELVVKWIEKVFTKKRKKFMQGVNWGYLYNNFKNETIDSDEIEQKISQLILDDDVTKKSGIYSYVLTKDESYLSIRSFSDAMKQKTYEKQEGKCTICGNSFDISDMEADHIKPWHEGGKTIEENCQMLCKEDNRRKSGR